MWAVIEHDIYGVRVAFKTRWRWLAEIACLLHQSIDYGKAYSIRSVPK